MLAENDTQRAYAEAERLQADLPADARPADQARLFNLLARIEVYQAQTEKAATHIQQAMELAKQHNDSVGQAEADLNTALNAVNQARIDDAIAATIHSLSVLDGVDRPDLLGEALLRMAMMYRRTDQLDESITMSMQALDIARQSNNPLALVYAYHGLAIAYELSDHLNEAGEYYQRMLEQARIAGSRLMEAYALMGVGYIQNNRGELESAERLIREAVAVFLAIDVPFSVNFSQYALADNLRKQQRYAETLPIFDEMIGRYQRYSNKIGLLWTLNARSRSRMSLGDSDGAHRDVEQAYALAKEIGTPLYLTDSAKQLAEIAAANGDHHQAYRFMLEASEMAAKMAKDTAAMRVLQLTRRYQTESKQREIDKLNRHNQQQAAELRHHALEQRWLWTVLGGSVVMLVGTGFFLVRLKRSHRRLAALNTQVLQAKNKLQATLDTIPDFLFELGLDGRYYDYHSPHSDLLVAPSEDLLGKTVPEVMPADAAEICMSALREAHENGMSTGKQFELSLPNGAFWFELSVAGKPAVQGEEPRFIVLSRNITERKQMEDALLISRQNLTEAQRIAHIGSWELDMATNVLRWSEEIFRIFEIDREQFGASYEAFVEIIHPDDREAVDRAYTESVENREPYEIEHRLLMADGRVKHVLERCETSYADDGKPLYSLGTVQDITERKRAEEALIARAREFRTLAESLPDNILRYDKEGRLLYVNPVLEKTLEADAAEMLGTTVRELFPNGEYDDYAQLLDTVLACGESGEIEKIVTPSDGQLHMIHNIRMIAECDENGEVIGALTIGRDITERKLSEDALKESEEKYRTLIQKIQAAVVVHGADTQILTSNSVAQEILGLSKDQLYGKTAVDPTWRFFREDGSTAPLDEYPVNKVLASGKALVNYVLGVHRPNNQNDVWALVNADPVFDKDGEITQVIVTFIDITQRKHTEEALAVREREFRTLAENIPDHIIRYDADARKIYVNSGALLGQTPEQTPPEVCAMQIDKFSQNIRRVLETGEPQELEVQVRHADEGTQIHNFRIVAERDEQGRIVGALAVGRDITKLKQAEHDIAVMSQALDKVHEAAYLMDDGAHFLYVNDESCRALGYSRDELLTMSVMDIGPGWTLEMVWAIWQRQREQGLVESFEAEHRRKDGGIFPVEINASQFEYDGKTYSLALVRDITERKRAEDEIRALNIDLEQRVLERTEELRLQTRYLRTLIDTLPMMAWLKDKDSRFLVVNQAMALACAHSVNELVGKSDLDCWPRKHAEAYRADDAEVMTAGQCKTVEELLADARDGAIWVETCKAPVFDEDGSVLGTVGTARDISDRKAMEMAREVALVEAERLARLRSEFMARMSHELRTPLNGIMGYTQILLGENSLNERQSVMLKVIQQSGEYLLQLINDILDFAKIEAGKQELNLSEIQLPRFLRNIASIITVKAEQKGLVFVCDIAEDVPAGIRADETRLRQVLLNLLSNAVKYSERGQVSLRVTVLKKPSPEGEGAHVEFGRLRFEIQDSGVGIDTGQLETIFQAFEQAGDRQQRTGGTGLGLPISRELVRLMDSEIFVSSRVGEGSTFWFDLDAQIVDVNGDIMPVEQHITGYLGPRQRVLVVDDTEVNRALLIDMLSRLGFETAEAANGRACLDSVETRKPDLILLDMVMPEMDGLETARRLRRMPGFGQTPIVAVSASASAYDVAEALKAGINVFLTKPIEIKSLMAQLAVLLKLDWVYALPKTEPSPKHKPDEWLDAPQLEEMRVLRQLAAEGSMRDIIIQADYLDELDASYRPFAEQLRSLAKGYQSKAVLDLVERYIDRRRNHSATD